MLSRHIHPKEDTLTASVLGHLLHLPIEIFWELLRTSCDGHDLPAECGVSVEVEPWPKWPAEGTTNTSYVEPDIFLRFKDFDLIIEAKRWDHEMQYENQWSNQLIAYHRQFGQEEKPSYYLALGGLGTFGLEEFRDAESRTSLIHKVRWQSILTQSQRFLRRLDTAPFSSSQDRSHVRILSDLIDLFAVHGFSTGRWFEDFQFQVNRPTFQTTFPLVQHHHLMSSTNTDYSSLLSDVRKSYRLLHDYQRLTLDSLKYIGTQLDIPFCAGWTRFSGGQPKNATTGVQGLDNWAWDWLGMYAYEFRFYYQHGNVRQIPVEVGQYVTLSASVFSDTGHFQTEENHKDKQQVEEFAPAQNSHSKIVFCLFRSSSWKHLSNLHGKPETHSRAHHSWSGMAQ